VQGEYALHKGAREIQRAKRRNNLKYNMRADSNKKLQTLLGMNTTQQTGMV